jgi:hypothetical protein
VGRQGYIQALHKLERYALNGQPGGMDAVLEYNSLTSAYPVEFECIKKELQTGELTVES